MTPFAKLREGVIEVVAGDEFRYAAPSFLQRVYLLWIFRNFRRLPVMVLSRRERHFMERLAQLTRNPDDLRIDPALIIGRAEFAQFPARKPLALELSGKSEERALGRGGTGHTSQIPLIGRTRRLTRYALSASALAFVIVVGTLVAQRLRGDQDSSTVSAKSISFPVYTALKNSQASVEPATINDAVVSRGEEAISKPGTQPVPVALRSPTGETPAIMSAETHSLAALKMPEDAAGDIGQSPEPRPQPKSETRRPHVLLAPRTVIYPVLPDLGSQKTEQSIIVKAIVNADGSVNDVQVPGQNSRVATAFVRTIKQWRYRPYVLNGQAIEVETHMVFTVLGQDAIYVRFLPPSIEAANP